ncbi:uncharacterized protein LOC111393290 [Olea europaea var. sylvestris]|uniref:uncharacterized protein LOC111393290 n=1 Tax=Olea europaea var. sylvestris TaxID=158386 RepID=UPI000C1CEEF0|nr:uncharacterized protein LOC111393290 [Olea europaea var. sylvestris]
MPLSIFRKLGLGEAKATTVSLQLADRSIKYPRGIIEDILVKVDKFIFSADFIILDMEEDHDIPIILGRSFLAIGQALIDVQEGQLIMRVEDEKVTFNILKAIKYPSESDSCLRVDIVDHVVVESFYRLSKDPLKTCLVCPSAIKEEDSKVEHMVHYLEAIHSRSYKRTPNYEDLEKSSSPPLPSLQQAPILDLKPLPSHLRYPYLGESSMLPVIIANSLNELEEEKLLRVLREHKGAIGWTIADIKGISPSLCMRKILMEDDFKPSVEHQRQLNPNMKEVVRAEMGK